MATIRFQALTDALSRSPKQVEYPANKASLYYSTNVFTQQVMHEYLPN